MARPMMEGTNGEEHVFVATLGYNATRAAAASLSLGAPPGFFSPHLVCTGSPDCGEFFQSGRLPKEKNGLDGNAAPLYDIFLVVVKRAPL